ncbi:MAG: S8 family serine peptidase [Hyphomicrobiales bacterium]|nr:S8 family serine peptidase [Hyphomicrobiales bacterium]
MSVRLRHLLTTTALIGAAVAAAPLALPPVAAQPTGGTVVGGTATVSGAGTHSVIVNQATDRAVINWNTFNIATGGAATFNQPGSSSITLNRVTGGLGPSVIDGTITANGRVFIVNRDGMLFGRNAVINTAGFLASTNDIRNADFMAGRMRFDIPGRSDASIVNLGTITATSGGFAALVAPGVRNSGTITANLGTVALASGNSFTLDMYGDKLIQLALGDEIASKVIDIATGKPLAALVGNDGRLSANGGRVEITAAAARHIVDSVINTRGVIEANSVGTRGGMIVLGGATASARSAAQPKQTVTVSGKLSATGGGKGAKGGTIQVTGEDIRFAAAMLDVSGHSGGGRILVGGDYGGGRPIPSLVTNSSAALEGRTIPTATTLTIDAATTLNASATASGHGGKVILWSDMQTTYAGTVFARGGAGGGDGGFVEVSGKQRLAFSGLVDTRAPQGAAGTLLLDPDDYPIGSAEAATIAGNLETGNVTILTGAAGSGGVGDITVNAPIVWSGDNSLTLSAYRNVVVNAAIANHGGYARVVLRADNTGTGTGTVSFHGGSYLATDGYVTIFYNPASYTAPTDYSGHVFGSNPTAYMLVNSVEQLDAIRTNLGGTYALGRNIDASATAGWNGGSGFAPIGNDNGSGSFHGLFDGQSRTISGLTVTSAADSAGMFGYNSGIIRYVNLIDVTVTGAANAQVLGGLAGTNLPGGRIEHVTVTGTVNAGAFDRITAGGLVGVNQTDGFNEYSGTILNSHAAVNVTIGNGSGGMDYHARDAQAGGLVGRNYGVINIASASGSVTGGGNTLVGGLVGSNGGQFNNGATIFGSWTTGNVLVQASTAHQMVAAGGLAGDNWASILRSYARGNVTITGPIQIMHAGGLVGQHRAAPELSSAISSSYASGHITVNNTYGPGAIDVAAGGLVGITDPYAYIADVYALGHVKVTGASTQPGALLAAGGLVGTHNGDLYNAYSTGTVVAGEGNLTATALGGFIGQRNVYSYVSHGYWDKDSSALENATGAGNSGGIVGLTTAQARTQSSYTADEGGFGFGALGGTWFMIEGQTRPFLRMEHSSLVRSTHELQLMAMDPSVSYMLASSIDFTGAFGASGMWGATGFVPVGSPFSPFEGSLDGRGFAINALKIAPDNPTLHSIGLFGAIGATGSVSHLNLTNAEVKANPGLIGSWQWLGVLAGQNTGMISHVGASGSVNGLNLSTVIAGGLVGQNGGLGYEGPMPGTITHAQAMVNVTAGDGVCGFSCQFNRIGGLVGWNNAGTISRSHATGAVSLDTGFGGGFVGDNAGAISRSHATGAVSSSGPAYLGGFAGHNIGTISEAYASGAVSGGTVVGGFVGMNLRQDAPEDPAAGFIQQAYALGAVTGNNAVVAGGFAALNLGSLVETYAAGHVQGNGAILGGLVGSNNLSMLTSLGYRLEPGIFNGTATNSYWDFQTTAMLTSAGGTGMNTSVLANGLPSGFNPAIWSHGSYPYLVNLGPQNTTPGPPVIGPVGDGSPVPPPILQIVAPPENASPANDPVPNSQQFVQQQSGGAAGGGGPKGGGSPPAGGGPGPQPIRLDVGENRFFYLPPPDETRLIANEVVIELPCDTPPAEVEAIVKRQAMTIVASQCLGDKAAYRMRFAGGTSVANVIRALADHRIVGAAQANYTFTLAEAKVQSATSQQGDPGQYVPEKLRLNDAHRMVTGTGVRIGVIDSEVDVAHPDYSNAIDGRYDATGVDDSPHPHGTGMTGAIASRHKLLGVAPGARILAIRAFAARAGNAESTTYHILRGIDWAIANKVRVINMSFAGPRDPSIERALKNAYNRDIVLIAAAGNAGPRAPAMYPAADPHVLAVTATDLDDRLFAGANRGNHIAIAAPGVDILVPAPAGEYQVTTGTSVATAHISGVVALMLERNPKLKPADVRKILAASARRLGPTNQFGAGRVDPLRAIEMASPRSAAAR